MANVSSTSISKLSANEFVKTAQLDEELSCAKIAGFHLRKTQRGATWRLRYTDFNGKRKKLSLGKFIDGTKDRTDAANTAYGYRNDLNKGIDPFQDIATKKAKFVKEENSKQGRTIGAYVDGAYKLHQSRKTNEGKHTLDMIRVSFSDYLNTPMDEITKQTIHDWQIQFTNGRTDKNTGEIKPRSYETVSRAYSALKTMIRHAYRNEVIATFPIAEVSLLEMSESEKDHRHNKVDTKRRMLTPDEISKINLGLECYRQQLIDGRENSRNHGKAHLPSFKNLAYPHWFFPFFRLAAYTGMRPGDLYSLRWHHLNLDFKRLVKVPNKTVHHKNPAKLDIPLNNDIIEVMHLWFEQQADATPDNLVFPSPITGKQLTKKAHGKPWAHVLKLGGIDTELDFYALRHHYISRLVSNGTPLFTVARLAGHKSTKMIEEHYGHLSPHHAAEALDAIAGDFVTGAA